MVAVFCIKVSRGGKYLEKLYWNVSPSCRSSVIHTSDCAHVSCLLPYSSIAPLVFLLLLWGPKTLGSQQLVFACDELALWLALYMFL